MAYELNSHNRIFRYSLSRLIPFCAIFISSLYAPLLAQTQLERISKAERSDGLGYVIRYHFTQSVDSFTVIQPAPDLIQMQLFASDIDTSGIRLPRTEGKIQEIRLYKLENSYGVDIYLDTDISVKSNAYFDQNGTDILLALTKADPYDVDVFTQQFIAENWFLEIDPNEIIEINSIPTPPINPDDEYNQVRDKLKFDTIVIDAGHGGHDPGNLGYKKRSKEKDIVLSIALKLGNYIEEYLPEVNIIYTRDDDTFIELEERGRIANRAEADLFVSIHADGWTSSKVYGSSVFFLGLNRSNLSLEIMKEENQVFNTHGVIEDLTQQDLLIYELAHSGIISTSERIAYMVEHQLRTRAGRKSRGVKQMGLVVLYQASMPGILVEAGFLTNPSEQRYLSSNEGQNIIASAIFRAIRDYKVEYEKTEAFSSSND